ncbi:hypothetical protein VE04_09584 [Pseudogymnoascus sp. 24MN13]|nr:hypothetical protein VE04_09584 [Pseudogymnoascus sp. 24MN13]
MPSTPHTPTHSRRPSALSISISPAPSSPRRHSGSLNVAPVSPGVPASNGLGNLADELADAWASDEDEAEPDMNFASIGAELADADADSQDEADSDTETKDPSQKPRERDRAVSISGSPAPKGLAPNPIGHRRARPTSTAAITGRRRRFPRRGSRLACSRASMGRAARPARARG